jgi:hypothetical protein
MAKKRPSTVHRYIWFSIKAMLVTHPDLSAATRNA